MRHQHVDHRVAVDQVEYLFGKRFKIETRLLSHCSRSRAAPNYEKRPAWKTRCRGFLRQGNEVIE